MRFVKYLTLKVRFNFIFDKLNHETMKYLFTLALFSISLLTFSQNQDAVLGKWKTIDDETGKEKSIVELYKSSDGKLYGKVHTVLNPEKKNSVCDKCEDDKKGQPIQGMVIVDGLEYDDVEWEDGTILDPNNGTYYDCKMWVDEADPNKLNVRGYVAFFFRTQYWYRVE